VKHTLDLSDNAENILQNIVQTLRSTGFTAIKPPLSPPSSSSSSSSSYHTDLDNNESLTREYAPNDTMRGKINHAFDVNTRQGRDLMHFITNLNYDEIEQRKSNRIDASAAALVARQLYKFQSIDGTRLGWSSSSLTKCLKMLTKAFDEHYEKFNVKSFYPLRLILSNDEFHSKLDLYGGTIMLNPGSTQIQWLDTLMIVSDQTLQILETNRSNLLKNLDQVQNALNVKIKKGFSCSSKEYYDLIKTLNDSMMHYNKEEDEISKALTLDRVEIVVETHQALRRAVVTKKGEIRISSSMSVKTIISSISGLRVAARKNVQKEGDMMKRTNEIVSMLRYEFGLVKIKKSDLSTVSNENYLDCLTSIIKSNPEVKRRMKESLAGQSLQVIGSGHSCHLGDDGSILIPWDWH